MKAVIYFLFDCLASVISLIALPILYISRKFGVEHFPMQLFLFRKIGVFPIRDHYYEPRFIYPKNINSIDENGSLNKNEFSGVSMVSNRNIAKQIQLSTQDLTVQLSRLKEFNHLLELNELPLNRRLQKNDFYVHNPNFGAGDVEMYYLMVRNKKPKNIIEIGSGYSTLLCLRAIDKNSAEGNSCNLICIEPFEMPHLNQEKGITLIRKTVEEVPLEMFQLLEANDILFVDSSHIIRPGNDVLHIFFQILPSLKKGVIIHIHDIFLPNHYPNSWLTEKMRFWNEQYLLEAFLYKNESYQVLFVLNYLTKQAFEETRSTLIHLMENSEPSSFWMQKIED